MESTLSLSSTATTLRLFTISKALNGHFVKTFPPSRPLLTRQLVSVSSKTLQFVSFSTSLRRSLCAVHPQQIRCRVECVSSSAASFGTGGGGAGGNVGGGEGGGGGGKGSEGGDSKSKLGGGESSALSSDVIILDVGGMSCGGCAASVKRILESQPQVSSASVNLTTETAVVWPILEAKDVPNWQQQLGEALAKHLTSCGFTSNLRVAGQEAIDGDLSP